MMAMMGKAHLPSLMYMVLSLMAVPCAWQPTFDDGRKSEIDDFLSAFLEIC